MTRARSLGGSIVTVDYGTPSAGSGSALIDLRVPVGRAQDALRHAVLAFVVARPDACERECVPGHITAFAAVLDHTGSQVLLTLHPRLGRWVQLGGHCEPGDADITAAALREATEESGIDGLRIGTHPVALHAHALTCSLGVPTRHLDIQFAGRSAAAGCRSRAGQSGAPGKSDHRRVWTCVTRIGKKRPLSPRSAAARPSQARVQMSLE